MGRVVGGALIWVKEGGMGRESRWSIVEACVCVWSREVELMIGL